MSFIENVKKLLGISPIDVSELNSQATREVKQPKPWKCRPEDVFKKEYVSFSRVNKFETCPRMFELVYLYGFEDKSGRPAQVGSLVHKIVELYTAQHKNLLSDRLNRNGAVEELLNFYNEALSCTELTYDISKSELIPYLSNFVVLNGRAKSQIQATEYECNTKIGNYKIKCIIDRIDRENQSTLTLIDYKTGSRQNVSRQQLNLYAYALSPGKWNPFELQYQFLKTGEISEWKYTAQLHSTTEQWLMSLIDKIENSKIFFKNKTRLCDYCGVSHHCYRVP